MTFFFFFFFFKWLNNILLHGYFSGFTFCLNIHQLMGAWVVSSFWLLAPNPVSCKKQGMGLGREVQGGSQAPAGRGRPGPPAGAHQQLEEARQAPSEPRGGGSTIATFMSAFWPRGGERIALSSSLRPSSLWQRVTAALEIGQNCPCHLRRAWKCFFPSPSSWTGKGPGPPWAASSRDTGDVPRAS